MNEKRQHLGKGFLLKLLVVTGLLLGLFSSISMATSTSTYYIRTGDTLLQVAANHDLTLAELLALNPQITNPNNVYVGTAIQVPSDEEEVEDGSSVAQCPQPYTVREGDTWFTIATAHGVDTGILALVNNMALTDSLTAGTSLCVPAAPAAPEVLTTTDTDTDTDSDDMDADDMDAADIKTPKAPPTRLPRPGEGDGVYYIVARGEYLSLIARRFSCTARVLAAVNRIANPSLVYVNTRLWVPSDCASLQPFLPAISVPRYVAPAPAPRPAPQPAPPAPQPSTTAPQAPQPSTMAPPAPQPAQPAPAPQAPAAYIPAPAAHTAPFNYRSHGPWTGQYYNNPNVQGGPAVTRQDAQIVFDWGAGSPASGITADGFSVQWTGTFFFTGATYRFIAMADDGIRVWVDDALIINGWKDQSRSLYYKDYAVRYGNHTVRVEYYDARLDATAVVNWAPR